MTKEKNDVQLYQFELNLLKDSIGYEVELSLSRGSSVRGIVTAFDQKYGKVAVITKENKRTKLTIVKLSYVVSFSIYDYKKFDAEIPLSPEEQAEKWAKEIEESESEEK